MNPVKSHKWMVHLENPYEVENTNECTACQEHIDYAKQHNMLVLMDEEEHIQGITFNHVMGRNVKTIKIGE